MSKMRRIIALLGIVCLLTGMWPAAHAAGYRLKQVKREGETIRYSYDRSGKCTTEQHYYNGQLDETVQYLYAKDGSLAEKIQSFSGDTSVKLYFHFDKSGTMIEMENPGMGGDVFTQEDEPVREQKDANGRTTMMTIGDTPESTRVYYYTYDSKGRITMFESSGFRRDVFTYYSDGGFNRTSTRLREGTRKVTERYGAGGRIEMRRDQYDTVYDYYYDQNGKLASEYYDGALMYSYDYIYDSHGNVTTMIRTDASGYTMKTEYQYEKA